MDRRPRRARRVVLFTAVGMLAVAAAVRVVTVNRAADDETDLPVAAHTAAPAEPAPVSTAAPESKQATQNQNQNQTLAARIEPRPIAPPPQTPPAEAAPPTPAPAAEQLGAGLALAQGNRPVEARRVLSAGLRSGQLSPADAEFARETLESLNRRLVFSPQVVPGDPYVRAHTVASGEQLGGIVRDRALDVDWRFILRVNNMLSERHLRAGQRLKLVTGPFHAVVDKSDYRMDLYMGAGDEAVYVTSLAVGLGAHDSTPLGRFRVRPGSRLENPSWANPRTGEQFGRDDPANPIGEYWIGLVGVDEATRDMAGYGIHGTIEPDSIGRQASMGCVRLLPDDIRLVFEVLTEASTVEIVP